MPSRYLHLGDMGTDAKTFFSAHHDDKGQHSNITNEDVSKALNAAAVILEWQRASHWTTLTPTCFEVAAPTPSPWRDIQIPKFKRWGGDDGLPSKEYTQRTWHASRGNVEEQENLFDFVNIAGTAFNTIIRMNRATENMKSMFLGHWPHKA